jgi:hypothetical protein
MQAATKAAVLQFRNVSRRFKGEHVVQLVGWRSCCEGGAYTTLFGEDSQINRENENIG